MGRAKNASMESVRLEVCVPGKGRVASPPAAGVQERALEEVLREAAGNRLPPPALSWRVVAQAGRSLQGEFRREDHARRC